jgi:hypothetical protein
MRCHLPAVVAPICLFFLVLGGIFGFVSLMFFLGDQSLVHTECQSTNISVNLETCYVAEAIWVTAYPYTGRIKFCFPVLYCFTVEDCRNLTICHWEHKTCGLTSDQLKSDLSNQYPLKSYTPCWYWNDSNAKGSLSYYPIYWINTYSDWIILFIITSICLGIILFTLILGFIYSIIKY